MRPQVDAFNQRHHVVSRVIFKKEINDPDDVGVLEFGDDFGLFVKPIQPFAVSLLKTRTYQYVFAIRRSIHLTQTWEHALLDDNNCFEVRLIVCLVSDSEAPAAQRRAHQITTTF